MGIKAYNRGTKAIRDSIPTPTAINSLPGSVNHPPADTAPATAKPFMRGEIVYCTVTALRGVPMEITAVNRDRIKVSGYGAWCPIYNFQRDPT